MLYAASTGGFYNENFHGSRLISIPDPDWVRTHEEKDAVHPKISIKNQNCKIPEDAVEINQEVYQALLLGQSEGKIITSDDEGMPVLKEPEPLSLAELVSNALIIVDDAAETARLKFITPGSAQAMVYQRKVQEAETLELDQSPDEENYMLLSAEIGITGSSIQEVAESVLAQRDAWLIVAAQIEQTRLLAKNALKAALDNGQVKFVLDGLSWPQPEEN